MKNLRYELGQTPLLGTFIQTPHPAILEVFRGLGFDLLCVDGEHSAINTETLVNLVRAADLADLPTMVRVADNTASMLGKALDAGATGVLVPHVESADEAASVVAASRYPPLGGRGVGPGRASLYGREMGSYVPTANENVLVAVQIETQRGVEQLPSILGVEGIRLDFHRANGSRRVPRLRSRL